MKTVLKLLTALAAVAGAVYVIATYGDKIDLQNDPNEYDNLWGSPDCQALIFEYYQKCFNHAILINEDTVLGKKAVY